nr:pentatricopeptide repeat-containing protein At2g28050 [Ipomoea trifida]
MSLHKLLQNLNTVKRCRNLPNFSIHHNRAKIGDAIINTVLSAHHTPTLLSKLTPNLVHLIISDPHLKTPKCIEFLGFLIKNQSLVSFDLNFDAHLTLVCRLAKAQEFADAEALLGALSSLENFRYTVLASFIESRDVSLRIASKVFNWLLKAYSDNREFGKALEIFDYMRNNGIEINERTCTVHLIELMKCDQCSLGLKFFYWMVESGIEVSVYSLTVVVDGLCKFGEVKRAREVVEEMGSKGIKPNIITFNTLVDACTKRWNFEELYNVLVLMQCEGVEFIDDTYRFLIDGFSSSGRMEDAERMIWEMHDKGFKVDTYLYNVVINGYCRLGNVEKAFSLVSVMNERNICLNRDTYWCLFSGLCKVGQFDVVNELVDVMQSKGFELDQVMLDTLIDRYLEEGVIEEAASLLDFMEKKGFVPDLCVYEKVIGGLCKLNRSEEARSKLTTLIKRGVSKGELSSIPLANLTRNLALEELVFINERKDFGCSSDLRSIVGNGVTEEAHVYKDEIQIEGVDDENVGVDIANEVG